MKKTILSILIVAMIVVSAIGMMACINNNKDTNKVKVVEIQLTEEEYAIGVKKGNTELLGQINEAMDALKADGTVDAIMQKYFAGDKVEGVVSAKKDSSKNQLVVATNAEFAPFEYKMGEKFAGIDMEIAKAIADKLGKELVIDDMQFDAVVTSVGTGLADMAIAGLTVTPKRAESVDFTKAYYQASQQLVVKAGDTTFDECKTAQDVENVLKGLTGKKAGFQNGTTGQYYVKGDESWGFAGFSNITAVGYDNAGLAVKDMLNGKIDIVVVDQMPAKSIASKFNK